jgi:SAM-dependent methyltransferase
MEIDQITDNLILRNDNIWHSKFDSVISYPDDGNEICFQVEDQSFWFNHRNRIIVKAIQRFPPNGVVFDVGGGNGFVSLALSNAGIEAVLLEPGTRGIINARERGIRQIIHSTLEDAGFKKQSIPAVGMFDVLEHIQDDIGFLKTLHYLMVPYGRLYITVPAHQGLWSVVDEDSGHYRRYGIELLKDVLSRGGFDVEFASYFFSPLLLPIFLFRTLLSRTGHRKGGELDHCRGELAHPSPLLNSILIKILSFETVLLNKMRIPFGASLIVVAQCN